jgi:hypothetical protein
MIENLENIRKLGIKKFLENEDVRGACSECGGPICVHNGYCYIVRGKINAIVIIAHFK